MGGKRGRLRPAGVRFYQDCVRPWEPLRNTPVPALRRRPVEDHIAARAAVAPTAARNELQYLKAALRAAQSRGQQVDVGIFEIDPIRVEAQEGVALEYAELLVLASWLPERIKRIKRIVPFCGTVGLRFTEAVTLTDDRVDLEAGTIFIPARINKSRRPKPIPLARLEVQLLREQLLARPTGARLVFPNEKGGVYAEWLASRPAPRAPRGRACARREEREETDDHRRRLPLPLAPSHRHLADGTRRHEGRADRRACRPQRRRRADLPPLPAPLPERGPRSRHDARPHGRRNDHERRDRRLDEWSIGGQTNPPPAMMAHG